MKEKLKELLKDKLSFSALIISALWFIWYFVPGAVIFKNMWRTSPAIVFTGVLFALAPLTLELLNIYVFKRRRIDITVICVSLALIFSYFLFFAFVLSKLTYFLIAGTPYFITAGLFALVAFFIFLFPKLPVLWKRISAIALSAVLFIISLVCVFGATPFYISAGAAVFAVEDEYQIAFATSHKSTGAVIVGEKTYYDQTNGENNVKKLHKISVPAKELEEAKAYSLLTQGVAQNTAYLPSKGAKIRKNYSFRPVDESDGLQIYNLSDTHECIAGPAKAAAYFGGKLDLLILNGDIINDVSSEYQISLIYKLANRITKGSLPVVYTRGNHECNGTLAADLGKYVGCADRGFYYTLEIGASLSMLILDTNNDMSDTNALISPIANFNEVRGKQSEWLKGGVAESWKKGTYNFVIAHMAYPLSGYTGESCHWSGWAKELVSLTVGADLSICGHSHRTDFKSVGEDDNTIAPYPVVRGSLRSNTRAHGEGVSPFEFTGTAIELKDGTINIKFTNAKMKVLEEHSWEV